MKHFTVNPTSRFNIVITGALDSDVPELTNEFFSAIIDSSKPVVVEHSLYFEANGVSWAAGVNAHGTVYPRVFVFPQ